MMEDFDKDWARCPCCDGFGEVACHCGGDQCYCDNHGERPCPLCGGDGEVSEAVYAGYIQRERETAAAFHAAWKAEGE